LRPGRRRMRRRGARRPASEMMSLADYEAPRFRFGQLHLLRSLRPPAGWPG
jgi:hypothetical protein